MTVRIRHTLKDIDTRRLAAILTPALLAPARDGMPESSKPGTWWVRWGEANQTDGVHLN